MNTTIVRMIFTLAGEKRTLFHLQIWTKYSAKWLGLCKWYTKPLTCETKWQGHQHNSSVGYTEHHCSPYSWDLELLEQIKNHNHYYSVDERLTSHLRNTSLVPRLLWGRGKKDPGTHCLCMLSSRRNSAGLDNCGYYAVISFRLWSYYHPLH